MDLRKPVQPAQTESSNNKFYIVIAAIAALSGILFGFDIGVVSGAILFINTEFNLSPQANGLVVSAVLLGALLGAMMSGILADHWGRKKLLLIDACIFIFGTIVTAVSPDVVLIIIGRVVVGVAIGVASYAAPLYISEISPAKYRGMLVSFNQLAITIGILISYIVDYYYAQEGAWRWMFAAGVIPAIVFFFSLMLLPDSPRWIASKGQIHDAFLILEKIYQDKKLALHELSAIEKTLDQPSNGSWRILFSPFIRSTLTIGLGLAILQQITGINAIIYYAPTIFQMAGLENATAAIYSTIGIGIIFVLFTILALPLIDTLGRRPLLLIGLSGMALSLLTLSISFIPSEQSQWVHWLTMVAMLTYIGCFAFSLGPIMWLMISEIYPLRVRGLGSSLATTVNWATNILIAYSFLTLVQLFTLSGTFCIYFVMSILGILFVYFLVPETKHVTLEQIEESLRAGLSFRDLGKQTDTKK